MKHLQAEPTCSAISSLKRSPTADGLGFIYRAVYALAQGDLSNSVLFLKQAVKQSPNLGKDPAVQSVLNQPVEEIKENRLIWAEKLLDTCKAGLRGLNP